MTRSDFEVFQLPCKRSGGVSVSYRGKEQAWSFDPLPQQLVVKREQSLTSCILSPICGAPALETRGLRSVLFYYILSHHYGKRKEMERRPKLTGQQPWQSHRHGVAMAPILGTRKKLNKS
jgi:hypothetical protein